MNSASDSGNEPLIRVRDRVLTVLEFNETFEFIQSAHPQNLKDHPEDMRNAQRRLLNQLTVEMILLERAEELGNYLINRLNRLKDKYGTIKEVRGMGLMAALEFQEPIAARIVEDALKDGLVLNRVSDHTLRFLPPLVTKKSDIDKLLKWLNIKVKEI